MLLLAVLLTACGEGKSSSSAKRTIGFEDPRSQVLAVALNKEAGEPTLVLMREPAAQRSRHIVFALGTGTPAEAVANADGRLGLFAIGEHRFLFTGYTPTHVTVTHYDGTVGSAPVGTETLELAQRNPPAVRARAGQAGPAVITQAQQSSLEAEVDDALKWFADASNSYLPLLIWRRTGEKGVAVWEKIHESYMAAMDDGVGLELRVKNALTCLTASLGQCGQETAEQTPQLMKELQAIDPSGKTSAGFNVSDHGISPRRDEWDPLVRNGTISSDFTVTEVSCAESVFADMNPKCPQYVAPMAIPSGGVDAGAGPGAGSGAAGGAGGGLDAGRGEVAAGPIDASGDAGARVDTGPARKCFTSCSATSCYEDCTSYKERYTIYPSHPGRAGISRTEPSGGAYWNEVQFGGTDKTVNSYLVTHYQYDSAGQRIRQEEMNWDVEGIENRHATRTTTYAEGEPSTLTVGIQCQNTGHVRRFSYRSEGTFGRPMYIYDTSDKNPEGCPSEGAIKGLAGKVFPHVAPTWGHIESSNVYQLFIKQPQQP